MHLDTSSNDSLEVIYLYVFPISLSYLCKTEDIKTLLLKENTLLPKAVELNGFLGLQYHLWNVVLWGKKNHLTASAVRKLVISPHYSLPPATLSRRGSYSISLVNIITDTWELTSPEIITNLILYNILSCPHVSVCVSSQLSAHVN